MDTRLKKYLKWSVGWEPSLQIADTGIELLGACRFGLRQPLVWIHLGVTVGGEQLDSFFLFDMDEGEFVFHALNSKSRLAKALVRAQKPIAQALRERQKWLQPT
jgi:hypothetical protein